MERSDAPATVAALPADTLAPTIVPLPRKSGSTIIFRGASFDDYWVTVGMEEPALDPILTLELCRDYTFVVNAPGHPFVIKTRPGLGLDNVLDVDGGDYIVGDTFPTEGMEQGSFTFRVEEDAPLTSLFYQCTLHAGMGSKIDFVDDVACVSATGEESNGSEEIQDQQVPSPQSSTAVTSEKFYGLLVAVLVAIAILQ
uniref:Uncharacterized protein n=2 Tax=Corethron hystrix TaxID=216773 RepID=A0A7S1B8I0_9STRA|mmetsp:Transcript_16973/g.38190  ORF Transcript_16973/g.38190 Transcript_16973/m.38190 type:complete len:198 (+) Transcript_16973:454-1047(+)